MLSKVISLGILVIVLIWGLDLRALCGISVLPGWLDCGFFSNPSVTAAGSSGFRVEC